MNRRGFLSLALGALVVPTDALRGLVGRSNIVPYHLPPRLLKKTPKMSMIWISPQYGKSLLSKWVDESEATIRQVFEKCVAHQKAHGYPTVVFLDKGIKHV